ncbi:MAG: tetratricopeptide repeat protein, partial [Stigonema ocellatum SAG 48.90 = DSM 106950]|nr:tetratricopeptide repeat protein [Stigonema ocellatum SAG 48.90 = DSM 106950]
MFNRLKSFTLATLLLSVTLPLLTNSVRADLPDTYRKTVTNPKTETDKLFTFGVQQYRHGQYPQALQTYGRVLELRRQQNDKAGIAQTLNNIGEVYLGLRLDDKADKVLQQALVLR